MANFFRAIAASTILIATVGAAGAQSDAISQRKAILKGIGDATKPAGAMLKGEQPFDMGLVQKALDSYIDGAKKLTALFPDNSKTGGDTAALPRIWDEKSKFNAIFEKLGADAVAAKASVSDEASFKANFGKVLGNCKACHDDYRLKKS